MQVWLEASLVSAGGSLMICRAAAPVGTAMPSNPTPIQLQGRTTELQRQPVATKRILKGAL